MTNYVLVPGAGLEPARAKAPRILSPLCLPFHHSGLKQLIKLKTQSLGVQF